MKTKWFNGTAIQNATLFCYKLFYLTATPPDTEQKKRRIENGKSHGLALANRTDCVIFHW